MSKIIYNGEEKYVADEQHLPPWERERMRRFMTAAHDAEPIFFGDPRYELCDFEEFFIMGKDVAKLFVKHE